MTLTFCPNCSNALTISRADPSSQYPLGVNRFECRTCPYQYIVDCAYYEDTMMKRKEVEDVFGGKDDFGGDTMAMHHLWHTLARKLAWNFWVSGVLEF
ncbi:hypothetical protein VTN49DRAFT_2254 [Thermomyces lanuginosus]|uniref:uncharacterized protein n=1 Tax=Thermomyces lanuginosus TaxID=5541 RepID=UPI0037446B6D